MKFYYQNNFNLIVIVSASSCSYNCRLRDLKRLDVKCKTL